MTQKARNSEQPASSVKLAVASLLVATLAAYAIAHGWVDELAAWIAPLVWVTGALTFGFGLARIFPTIFRGLFQAIGYLAAFSAMMLVVLFSMGRELPTFNGTVNTGAVSNHLSTTAKDIGKIAEQSSEGMVSAIAEMREVVGQ